MQPYYDLDAKEGNSTELARRGPGSLRERGEGFGGEDAAYSLSVDYDNLPAIALYTQFGFQNVDTDD